MDDVPHRSVLIAPFLDFFRDCSLRVFVDGTVGAAGHAAALLEAHSEVETFVGLDQDATALAIAAKRLSPWQQKVVLEKGNFAQLPEHLEKQGITAVDGIFLDLGVSSMQLDRAERGFSFSKPGPLDMRMDTDSALTAMEIVNTWPEEELARIFRAYGEEQRWRAAARHLVRAREHRPLETTDDLVAVLEPVVAAGRHRQHKRIHPMTLIFQALRIAVNGELEVLEQVLPAAIDVLRPGGRLGVISFHRLEDRIVKKVFRFAASDKMNTTGLGGIFVDKEPTVKLLTRKAVGADEEEIRDNPRCRSAKMRFVEKL